MDWSHIDFEFRVERDIGRDVEAKIRSDRVRIYIP